MERNWQKSPEARNEFAIEGDVVWIKLNHGQETCVDLEDWEKVKEFKWRADKVRNGDFYAIASVKLHSLVLGDGGKIADHKNHETLDNRKSMLRAATTSQNCANREVHKNNTTGFKGVWRAIDRKDRWQSKAGGKYLGRFDSPIVAAMAYDRAALEKYGEFARLNFPRGQFGAFAL